jgi:hypothetical protein
MAVTLRAPIGDVADAPERLQWEPVAGAVRYHAQLAEVDRREVWSADTSGTSIAIPAPVRGQVVPGKTLVWTITAYDAAGVPIAESDRQRFRVAR